MPTTTAKLIASNYGCISLGFRDADDVKMFGLNNVSATSAGHTATVTGGFDFLHGFPISVLQYV